MHELAIAQSILEITERHAQENSAICVRQINLVIGDWSSVIDDSLAFYWPIISKDSIAEQAQLHFERLSPQMHCKECLSDFQPDSMQFTCPQCGGQKVEIIQGMEFYVDSIDIDDESSELTSNPPLTQLASNP